jgi:hypothetical protein
MVESFRFKVPSFKLGRGRERWVGSLSYAEGGEDDVEDALDIDLADPVADG